MASSEFTDSHVHFWDLRHESLTYEWLEPDGPPEEDLGDYSAIKAPRYWMDDFVAESRLSGTTKAVHVQAAVDTPDPVEETAWLQSFADRFDMPLGIVAAANLEDPRLAETLDRHGAHANFRGIRDLRYDDYLSREGWRAGYAQLEERGLVCCADPLVEVMDDAAELAQRFPGITLCIDHAGYPRRRDSDYFQQWRRGMRAIAKAPNTVVKISGLGMCDHAWTLASIRPWVLECIDAWGTERAFFGTNWPVDRLFSSYRDVVEAYRELISDLTTGEQEALLSANADRVFRLG